MVSKKTDQLNNLIVQLLDLSRIELGKFELKKEFLTLNKIIKYSLENFQTIFKEKEIKCRVYKFKEPVWVIGNELRLTEVMNNLLSNAAKFTPSRGRIVISCKKTQDNLKVSVQDSGKGISENEFENIFNSFYQVDSSSTRKYSGAGLGLAIVKNIIDSHNGKIWVESKLNKGSKFTFMLPIAKGKGALKIKNILRKKKKEY